jgi:hypothetical protein
MVYTQNRPRGWQVSSSAFLRMDALAGYPDSRLSMRIKDILRLRGLRSIAMPGSVQMIGEWRFVDLSIRVH